MTEIYHFADDDEDEEEEEKDAQLMPLIDTHIHLSHPKFEGQFTYLAYDEDRYVVRYGDLDKLLKDLRDAGVKGCIGPGIDFQSNLSNIALAEDHPDLIYPAIGIHPARLDNYTVVKKRLCFDQNGNSNEKVFMESRPLTFGDREALEDMARYHLVVAIGETGLDYSVKDLTEEGKELQKSWFSYFLDLAKKLQKPVILHIRSSDGSHDAMDDALKILRSKRNCLSGGGVVHAFDGNAEDAAGFTELGLSLGIGGKLMSEDPHLLEEAVKDTPIERLLLETDGPYLKPFLGELTDPGRRIYRNVKNCSLILPAVAKRIAELKGLSTEEVALITTENARTLFSLRYWPFGPVPGEDKLPF